MLFRALRLSFSGTYFVIADPPHLRCSWNSKGCGKLRRDTERIGDTNVSRGWNDTLSLHFPIYESSAGSTSEKGGFKTMSRHVPQMRFINLNAMRSGRELVAGALLKYFHTSTQRGLEIQLSCPVANEVDENSANKLECMVSLPGWFSRKGSNLTMKTID